MRDLRETVVLQEAAAPQQLQQPEHCGQAGGGGGELQTELAVVLLPHMLVVVALLWHLLRRASTCHTPLKEVVTLSMLGARFSRSISSMLR